MNKRFSVRGVLCGVLGSLVFLRLLTSPAFAEVSPFLPQSLAASADTTTLISTPIPGSRTEETPAQAEYIGTADNRELKNCVCSAYGGGIEVSIYVDYTDLWPRLLGGGSALTEARPLSGLIDRVRLNGSDEEITQTFYLLDGDLRPLRELVDKDVINGPVCPKELFPKELRDRLTIQSIFYPNPWDQRRNRADFFSRLSRGTSDLLEYEIAGRIAAGILPDDLLTDSRYSFRTSALGPTVFKCWYAFVSIA